MRLGIKRIYCRSCSHLVKGQEQIEKEDVAKIHLPVLSMRQAPLHRERRDPGL